MTPRLGLLAAAAALALALPASASAATDLAGFWHLDESAGTTASDDSANANHGTIDGASRIAGRFTRALTFDGVDDQVVVARDPSMEPQRITVEAWVRAPTSPGSFRYVLANSANQCQTSSYGLYTGLEGGLGFVVSNGDENSDTISPFAPPTAVWDGQWHHVAGTYDGSSVRMYVDGVEVGTGTPTTLPIAYGLQTSTDTRFGTFGGTCSLPYTGDLDEPRVWRRALSPVEIAASEAMGGAATTRLDQETDSTQSVAFTSRFTGQDIVISTESATGTERISSIKLVGLLPVLSRVTCRGGLLSLLNSNCTYTLSNEGRTASMSVRPLLGRPVATLRVRLASGRSFDVEVDTGS